MLQFRRHRCTLRLIRAPGQVQAGHVALKGGALLVRWHKAGCVPLWYLHLQGKSRVCVQMLFQFSEYVEHIVRDVATKQLRSCKTCMRIWYKFMSSAPFMTSMQGKASAQI